LAKQYPDSSALESAEVVPLLELMVGDARGALLTLLAAVGVVVLIACANVANLLLVRASVREKEIAIRTALGASRGRLARQMLAESLILAVLGAGVGLLLARLAIAPIRALSAGSIPRVQDISVDGSVLLFALAVAVAVGMLFGMAPAWQAARADVAAVIKEGGRSSAGGGARWTRSTLLVAEVALSLVLLVGAALLLRSFSRLIEVDPGFRSENVLAFRVALPQASYRGPENRAAFFDQLLARLRQAPGVRAAGMVQTLPMRGDYSLSFTIQGRPEPTPGNGLSAAYRLVSPDYFAALGIPLKRGRVFDERDHAKSKMVAVVDEAFAARHFASEDALGHGIDIGNGSDGFYEIVGVVGSIRESSLDAKPSATMYVPYAQDVFSAMWVVARTDAEPLRLSAVARDTVRQLDPALPAFAMTRLSDVVSESIGQRRFAMLLLGAFAAIALLLAAVGIYGVVAYSVTQRTAEIGVRLAVGAAGRDILALVVGGGMRLALLGVGIGLVSALALSRVMEKMLFEVTPLDPISYAVTAATLLAVAVLACYVPARRAMAVDPLSAIRQE
jgi:putative ABC transport system permease protein